MSEHCGWSYPSWLCYIVGKSSYIARALGTEPWCALRYDPYAFALQHDARVVAPPVTGVGFALFFPPSHLDGVHTQCELIFGACCPGSSAA